MLAAAKVRAEKGIELIEVREPEPRSGEVLLAVSMCGICGSDLPVYEWRGMPEKWSHALPRVMGHEFAGRVLADTTSRLPAGTLVAVEPGIGCGTCDNCRDGYANLCLSRSIIGIDRDGAFAARVVAPAGNVHVVPPAMAPERAAFLEVFALAMHAQERAKLLSHERALIVGSGPVGLSVAALCRLAGLAEVVVTGTEADAAFRFGLARAIGAMPVLAHEMHRAQAFDVTFETSGAAAGVRASVAGCRTGGRVVAIGTPPAPLDFDWNDIVMRGVRIVPIRARLPRHWERGAEVLARLDLPAGFFSEFALRDAAVAFDEAARRGGLKVMIRPDGS